MRCYPPKILIASLLLATAVPLMAVEPDAITGTWLTSDEDGQQDSVVEIFRDGDHYVGEVRWIRFLTYPADDPMAGQAVVDRANPDPALRERSVMGLRVLWGLRFNDGEWVDGRTYAARKGKTYKSKATLVGKDKLKLRGYIGTPMLGKTVIWERSEIPPKFAATKNEN
ncbi:MAG: DUF2147 domain-containing protein [Oceanococcus sp.]